jgi:hypothetical protein
MSVVNSQERDRYYEFKMRELENLRKENFILKRTIQASLGHIQYNIPPEINLDTVEEDAVAWPERAKHFAGIRSQVLETVKYLCSIHGRAVSTDELMHCFENRHRKTWLTMKNPGETIPRRCREMTKSGHLISPQDGNWFIGPRVTEPVEA